MHTSTTTCQLDLFNYVEEAQIALHGDLSFDSWTDHEILVLRMALIQRALSLIADVKTSRQTKTEEICWIYDLYDPAPFSFDACCDQLGMDADLIRQLLKQSDPMCRDFVMKTLH